MNPILLQAIYYGVVLILGFMLVNLMQRGFFMPFLRVKLSFGKLIICKIRAVNRDYYRAGKIDEGFLVFPTSQGDKRIAVKDKAVFYRSLGVAWVDVDEEKNALVNPDFKPIDGFDAMKYNSLYIRALYRPALANNKEKVIIGICILIVVMLIILGFFVYKVSSTQDTMLQLVNTLKKGLVVG